MKLLRLFIAAMLLVTGASSASSNSIAEDEQVCYDTGSAEERRIEACGRLIDNAVYTNLPDYANAHLSRASAFAQVNALPEALSDLDIALDYDPYSYPAYMARGNVLLRMREVYRAIADFSVAAGINPLEAEPYAKRGLSLFAHKEHAAALKDLETALGYNPNHADARRTAAWILAAAPDTSLRDGPRALSLLESMDQDSQNKSSLLVLAAAQAEAGQLNEAVATYATLAEGDQRAISRYEKYLTASGYLTTEGTGSFDDTLQQAIRSCLEAGCRIGAPR